MRKARAGGFTIVEVMIVLAVTGALFVSAALLISGRQNKTQFDQAIRQIQTDIQQTINDVGSGFYPSNGDFKCTATASGPSFTNSPNAQGANSGCIFLGKVMQFKVKDTDPEQFKVYSVAGLQKKLGSLTGQEVTTLAEALPTVAQNATDTNRLQYGLTTVSVTPNVGGIAFVSSLAKYGSDGLITSGSQQVDVVPVAGSTLNQDETQMIASINARGAGLGLANSTPNPSSGVRICFASGGTDQSGLITIGSNGRQLSVALQIKGNKTCA